VRRLTLGHDVGGQLSLKHRPDERRVAAGPLDGDDIGDDGAIEPRGQLRSEVARLIRVRQQNIRR